MARLARDLLVHRRVESGDEFDEGLSVERLLNRFLVAEKLSCIAEQVVLRLVVAGENQDDEADETAVARIEVNSPLSFSDDYKRMGQPIHARVRDGDAIFPAAGSR